MVGQAQTGTGKTAAFSLPIIERLAHSKKVNFPRALILVPTRELAVQVREEFKKLALNHKLSCVAIYGGKPIRGQIEKLKRSAQVVVGTPGRVLDIARRGALELSRIRCVVLDEADRMLDIGFRPDIERILKQTPSERQTLLLSATIPPPIERLSQRYMRSPEKLNFSPKEMTVDTIDQYYFTVPHSQKFDLLLKLLEREQPKQSLIFCRTKRGTDRIHERLKKKMDGVACIHGDMDQRARDRVMEKYRSGTFKILVATDVVGRGIDVAAVSHIINFDIPEYSDDYVHRVGRTGRMGREGIAFTFVTPEEGNELTRIEQRINRQLIRDSLDMGPPPELPIQKPKSPEELPPPPPSSMVRGKKRYRRGL